MSNDQKGFPMTTSVLHTDMHMSLPYTVTYMCVHGKHRPHRYTKWYHNPDMVWHSFNPNTQGETGEYLPYHNPKSNVKTLGKSYQTR